MVGLKTHLDPCFQFWVSNDRSHGFFRKNDAFDKKPWLVDCPFIVIRAHGLENFNNYRIGGNYLPRSLRNVRQTSLHSRQWIYCSSQHHLILRRTMEWSNLN